MSAMITVLVTSEELSGEELLIRGDTYRHLFRSRRQPQGVTLRLVDGHGAARWGEVVHVGPKEAAVSLGAPAPANEPNREVRLLVAAPRFQRASWLVEKGTELGVAEILFLGSERSPRTYGEGNLERLRRVAASALQQCHGSRLPKVGGIFPFATTPDLVEGSERLFLLDPESGEAATVHGEASSHGDKLMIGGARIALAVGPEGGWSSAERERLLQWGFLVLRLGSRVLRVETAAVVGAAAALGLLGSTSALETGP